MRRAITLLLAVVGVTASTLFLAVAAYAGPADVVGTKHDLGPAGTPVCSTCHTPHDAQGDYLWSRPVGAGNGIKPLCYSCHDGTVTNTGKYAFDAKLSQHRVSPGVQGRDCDRCHDPHSNSFKFTTLGTANADVCSSCHGNTQSGNHPVDVAADKYSPTDRVFDPNLMPSADTQGTRLYNAAGTAVVTSGPGYIKCLTCHSAHGGAADSRLNTMPLSNGANTTAPLCQNCHK